jgi:hypothetical protein
MKNITLAIDEKVLKSARKVAVHRDTTINTLVRGFLGRLAAEETERERARRELLGLVGRFDGEVGRRPRREELHARR